VNGSTARGGRRRWIVPGEVPVWVSSGRWGPRRARVGQCSAILGAELVYHQLICKMQNFGPGWRATLSWKPHGDSERSWDIKVEVLPNAVWRRGRLFLLCPHCGHRATRLYVPVADLQPRCRSCWGLNYGSQSWSYKPVGIFGRSLGPIAYATTAERRRNRRRAALERYKARRPFLKVDQLVPPSVA
jgi:hypothetical protein